ncbi:MAG: hypothetical protein LDL13_06040 [Calditerrivibrio sp.]|nr:hypothetical protein [Calditerrivibrio sp.]MCA1933117.1 hypothetical protein [Calditerrivibrio sp.]MCA1980031.1 hypothetical protein [Calditerrivibrio sp.]
MNKEQFEKSSLFFYKIIDGINLRNNKDTVVFDASFCDTVIPEHLAKKYNFEKIFYLTNKMINIGDHIVPVAIQSNVPFSIMRRKSDLFISIGGSFNFQPIYDTIHAIHKSLNAGGKFIIATYPEIYDSTGRDILNGLSLISELPIKEKLTRWNSTVKNALSNIFFKVETDQIITKVESIHIIEYFKRFEISKYLFNKEEDTRFFKPIEHLNVDYIISWNIIKGIKI